MFLTRSYHAMRHQVLLHPNTTEIYIYLSKFHTFCAQSTVDCCALNLIYVLYLFHALRPFFVFTSSGILILER